MSDSKSTGEGIAVIGMAGRFPRARTPEEFWNNMLAGRECVTWFGEAELEPGGIEFPRPEAGQVAARAMLEDADLFDAHFFGINPREAEVMDPQHRLFLECSWEALEDAGCDPDREQRLIGVYAGTSLSTYLISNLLSHPELFDAFSAYQLMLVNDKDFLPTRVSYKLNLRGPSVNVQTACSTSLVAVCVACQNLLTYQCDLALAGGVSVTFPQKQVHLYHGGGLASPDGHCRAFDAKASGTVPGEGLGIVVLKRLDEAVAEGDSIYAVIRGFGMNNDGSTKAGYTAPSEQGQAEAIAWAHAMAGIDPSTVGYLEAHGTGTPLGDPIEIAALTRAFRAGTDAKNYCAIASVKSAIGHLDVAAGVAGFINAVLAVHHGRLPPTLNFDQPNPRIDFASSPFYVNTRAKPWPAGLVPRRAGVSSFGIGSTNAHVVIEQAPDAPTLAPVRPAQLLVLSAKTAEALEAARVNLESYLRGHPDLSLADAAYTLQVGRRAFAHRGAVTCRQAEDLFSPNGRAFTGIHNGQQPCIAFLFPGQGAQRVNMGRDLYACEPVFRNEVDRCAQILELHLGLDIRSVLYPEAGMNESADAKLDETALSQPVLFVVEYALAQLWRSWGIRPQVMLGHSLGEIVAATLAEVFSLETALGLVATRARLIQQLPGGAMLAVRLSEPELVQCLPEGLSLAAVNGARQTVVSGPKELIADFERDLAERRTACQRLKARQAFHSVAIDSVVGPFTEFVRGLTLRAPRIPFLSNVTGTWITAEQAMDAAYWGRQMRQGVRFAEGLRKLIELPDVVLLESGPGQSLGALARQSEFRDQRRRVVSSMPAIESGGMEVETLVSALGQLWVVGAPVDWDSYHAGERRRRVHLPTYPFQRARYWIDPVPVQLVARPVGGQRQVSRAAGETATGTQRPGVVAAQAIAPEGAPLTTALTVAGFQQKSAPGRIELDVRTLFGSLLGVNLLEADGEATFLELGFDSLMLTQAGQALERKFGVRISFVDLMSKLFTFDLLTAHLTQLLQGAYACQPTNS